MANKWVQRVHFCWLIILNIVIQVLNCLSNIFTTVEEKSVRNEIVLITGAARGIGKDIAIKYAGLEATLVCVDINQEENEKTLKFLNMIGAKAYAYQCDLSNHDEVKALREQVEKEVGIVTILVANAGIAAKKNFVENIPDESFKKIFDVNFMSLFWLLKEFLPSMKKLNKGHIVTMSSITALGPLRGLSAYSISKCAVSYLMRATREEVEHEGINIKFTTVYPDFTYTPLVAAHKEAMPLMLTSKEVAEATVSAQRRGKSDVSIPWHFYPLVKILNVIKPFSGAEVKRFANLLEGTDGGRNWNF